jgi:hypothetical protein
MSNLLNKSLKFRTVVMFATDDIKPMFHTEFVDVFIFCLHTELHTFSSNGPLIAYRFRAGCRLFYIFSNKIVPYKSCILFEDNTTEQVMLRYITLFVASTLLIQARSVAMLIMMSGRGRIP